MKLTIRLEDEYANQDITVVQETGETISDLVNAFKTFALAAGYAPENVEEYFNALDC